MFFLSAWPLAGSLSAQQAAPDLFPQTSTETTRPFRFQGQNYSDKHGEALLVRRLVLGVGANLASGSSCLSWKRQDTMLSEM